MRCIGVVSEPQQAEQFAAYLARQGVSGSIIASGEGFGIWVDNEDHVPRAKEDLQRFRVAPSSDRFRLPPKSVPTPSPAAPAAPPGIESQARRRPSGGRVRSGRQLLWPEAPVTMLLMALAVAATFLSGFGKIMAPVGARLMIEPLQSVGDSGWTWVAREQPFTEIRQGEIWRLWTPVLMHFHWLHLLLNLQWTYVFGSAIEAKCGSLRLLVLVLLTGVLSNLAQYVWTGPTFGGLSGVGHGLFGYVWMLTIVRPRCGLILPRIVYWGFWIWFVLCFTGLVGPIANMAHAGGLVAGMFWGLLPALRGRR